jgi:hypothetical protein
MRRLRAQPSHVAGVSSPASVVRSISVIARSSHAACHSFFTGAPRGDRRGAALDGAAVHAEGAHDVEIERRPRVPLDVVVGEAGGAAWRRARGRPSW